MLNKITAIRLLMLAGLTSVMIVPALLMMPEVTIGQNRVQRTSLTGIIDWLLGKNRKQKPISRGDLCLVSPQGKIYSTNPVFLWKGKLNKIAVAKLPSRNNFWNADNLTQDNLATYTGAEALEPGEQYQWKAFLHKNPSLFAKFQVLDGEERQKITDGLAALEKRLQTQGADEKTIALEKAAFFAEHNLRSDVLQQVYSVPNLAQDLSLQTKDLLDKLCKNEQNQQQVVSAKVVQ
ncbi:hypothetical protein H6G41_17985 [Tolypothrix sp. FACHB-123]|uniref:hypothetical protein n=1 Tax=Tolypothrix sp. FACHB-123 TaxID=2692868 RepID=UPI0016861708|nr:hypothetical protein [Tolypothrix sp. FACHB-123]MBD2356492.1 hypothetical protein [Tolypothrix sp. FACHB-123]